jgi:expansin
MQVVNANKAVASLEVSTNGGSSWTDTTRQSYNFFQYSSGFGTTTVDVMVTSIDGDVIVVNNVEVVSGTSTTASSNFGSSGTAADVAPAAASPSVPPTQAVTADTSITSSATATPAVDTTPQETIDADVVPTLTQTTSLSAFTQPGTMMIYTPSTTSVATTVAAVTTVTVYESCTNY